MNKEIWKPVPSESNYEASSYGNVRRKIAYRGPNHGIGPGKHLVGRIQGAGYKYVCLSEVGKKQKMRTIHGLVAEAFYGPRLEGMQVNHKDGNKLNNHVDNLEYVTQSENMLHAYKNGMRPNTCGEGHHKSRLTESMVVQIRKRCADGETYASLAREFNVDETTISYAHKMKTWKNVHG